jgi:uncharacterized protein YciI
MLTLLLLSSLAQAATAQAPAPAIEMTTYQMVLLKKGSAAPPAAPEVQMQMQEAHLARLAELNRTRVNLLYGPVLAPGSPVAGIAVLDVKTADEAKQAFADDPFVKAGVMVPEVHAWYGPKNWFHQPASYDHKNPASLEQFVLGFLVRGTTTSQDKAAADELQKGHLAYMETLHAQGKLPVAGPFGDDGRMRGIVIYRVKDVAEANVLAAEDPAVKAGRLTLEAYPWMTFKGILR